MLKLILMLVFSLTFMSASFADDSIRVSITVDNLEINNEYEIFDGVKKVRLTNQMKKEQIQTLVLISILNQEICGRDLTAQKLDMENKIFKTNRYRVELNLCSQSAVDGIKDKIEQVCRKNIVRRITGCRATVEAIN